MNEGIKPLPEKTTGDPLVTTRGLVVITGASVVTKEVVTITK